MDRLRDDIERDEGLRLRVYPDTQGHPTVGWGHKVLPEDGLMLGDVIPMERAERFLEHDLTKVIDLFCRLPHAWTKLLSAARRRVICNMIFQHGLAGTRAFRLMWFAIEREDWEEAARQIVDSDSGRKYPQRMGRLAETMRRGGDEI